MNAGDAVRRHLLTHAAAALPLLAGCGTWSLPSPEPMELLLIQGEGPYAAPTLVVMLPGAYSQPGEFADEGFIDALRTAQVPADVLVAGATLGHYVEGRVVERLHDEVVAPARARGVRSVWLLGVSLGGLFALSYASRHADQLDGVLLLAPYLGRRTLLAEIDAAGGPEAWAAGRRPRADDLPEHEVWAWLATRPSVPPLYLGFGRDDRFADAHRRLAARLPRGHVDEIDGGHDWPAWRALWQRFLQRGRVGA
ncbi:MAG: alpha/beta hydrolase-fold protein [Rubrivivax sp.]